MVTGDGFVHFRERNLWLLALAVVAAIYSTLGLARTLADELRRRDLIDNASFVVFIMMAAAVVVLGLKMRAGDAEVGVALGITGVYLMVFLRMATPEERTHLVEYGVLAVFIYEALKERAIQGRPVPRPAVLAVTATALLGWLDEGIQLIIPGRFYDWLDVGFNALAAVMAVLATLALTWARSRRVKSK